MGSGGEAPPFLTSALDEWGGRLHALVALAPDTHWIGGLVGSGHYGEEENLLSLPGNRTPAVQSVACRYTD
jgi:hypothetical protein